MFMRIHSKSYFESNNHLPNTYSIKVPSQGKNYIYQAAPKSAASLYLIV